VQTALSELAKNQPEYIEFLPVVNPATPNGIDALLEQRPHIFHFIGHGRLQNEDGEDVGEIALVKKVFNTANWVDASFFGGLFNRHRPGIVFLQACEGGMLSESEAFVGVASKIVQQNIPVVVAMQYGVSNITATQFAYEFYERLAKDTPVDIAVQNARRSVALETQYRKRDFATPVIFMRVQDGYLFQHSDDEGKLESETMVNREKQKEKTVHASGDRSIAVGGDVTNSAIIPGDRNVVQWGSKYNINIGKGENIDIGDKSGSCVLFYGD
jgi:hypothetical protein